MSAHTSSGFGAKLREARERRGVSLREIAEATKISPGALDALERNDIARLPGGIFSRAFVRAYALEVGLDPEETIREFMAQFPNDSVTAGHPAARHDEDEDAVDSDRRVASTALRLLAVSIPLMVVVLYFGRAGRAPEPAVTVPPSGSAPLSASTSAPAPAPQVAAPLPVPSVDKPAQTTVPIASLPEAGTSGLAVQPPSPRVPVTPPAPERLSIVLSATGPTWVTITVDGEPVIDRQVEAGEREVVEVRRDFVLKTADAGAVALTINGAETKPLGKPGETVTARLNLANFRNYLAP